MHKQQNSVAGGDIDDNGQSNGSATSLFQLVLVLVIPPLARRQGWGYSNEQLCTYIRTSISVYGCNNFAVLRRGYVLFEHSCFLFLI